MNWLKKIILLLFRIIPMKNDIVLESHPDFSDNTYALYQAMLRKGIHKKHHIYWLVREPVPEWIDFPPNVSAVPRESGTPAGEWNRIKALYLSRFILDSNSYIKKRREGQIRIHLGHGMPIKYIPEYLNPERIGECDAYLTLGHVLDDFYTEEVGLPGSVLQPLGHPRNDVLVPGEHRLKKEAQLRKFIIWMPTYRQHKNHQRQTETVYPFGMPEITDSERLKRLNERLGQLDLHLVFRSHPAQDLSLFETIELTNITVADDHYLQQKGCTLYELISQSAALITDYSSVYFDYLLLERPIGLTRGDSGEYFSCNQCVFENLYDEVQGFWIDSFEELLEFLSFVDEFDDEKQKTPELQAQRDQHIRLLRERKKRFHTVTDGTSCEKILDFLEM